MDKKLKTIVAAFGSLLAIYPATNYADMLPKGDASERIRGHWEKTGTQLRESLSEYKRSYGRK